MSSTDKYIPGVCNIGPAEIKARRAAGYFGTIITIVLLIGFYVFSVHPVIRLLIFIPAAIAAIGFLQAQLHFCVQFGMNGLFNFGDDLNKQESIDQAEYRRKDQQKAITIMTFSVVIALGVTLVAYWLPASN